jgi:Fe2+ or Zn2+ uptake regulation protein
VIDVLIRILKKYNRPMSLKEITKEVTKEKMVSPNTVSMNLQKYKDIFQRTEK